MLRSHHATLPCPLSPAADGMRVILKAMGKEPFPPARGPGSVDTVATEEQARGVWGCVSGVSDVWCHLAGGRAGACLACQLAQESFCPGLLCMSQPASAPT